MANEDSLSVTFLVSCADPSRLNDARRVLTLSEGIGGVELSPGTAGQTLLTMIYDPGQTTPAQAVTVLAGFGCEVLTQQDQFAQGEGGADLAAEVDLLGHPVEEEK